MSKQSDLNLRRANSLAHSDDESALAHVEFKQVKKINFPPEFFEVDEADLAALTKDDEGSNEDE